MIDLVEAPEAESPKQPAVAYPAGGSLLVFDKDPGNTLALTLSELRGLVPPQSVVRLFDKTAFTKSGAWDILVLESANPASMATSNPWRKHHTSHYWAWGRPIGKMGRKETPHE